MQASVTVIVQYPVLYNGLTFILPRRVLSLWRETFAKISAFFSSGARTKEEVTKFEHDNALKTG
jgi:hypothetical protein